ncbi:gp53-like domain-containing protein [Pseudomonas protegens]
MNQGTARVATLAQTFTGTDDSVIVTPNKLRWGFSISLSPNGYIALPSWLGGLILQWGVVSATGGTAPFGTLNFPMAFPGVTRVVLGAPGATNINVGLNTSGSGGIPIVAFDLITLTGARWRLDSNNGTAMSAGIPIRWIAIGS